MFSRLSVVELFGDWKNLDYGMVFEKSMGFFCAAPSVNLFFPLQSLLKDDPNLSASYIRQATRIKICTNQETHWPANRNLFSKHAFNNGTRICFNGIHYDRNWFGKNHRTCSDLISRLLPRFSFVIEDDFWNKIKSKAKYCNYDFCMTCLSISIIVYSYGDVYVGGEGLRIYTYVRCLWQNIVRTKVVK